MKIVFNRLGRLVNKLITRQIYWESKVVFMLIEEFIWLPVAVL